MAKRNIEGVHLRWFIIGAIVKDALETTSKPPEGISERDGVFSYLVSDTCNRVHKYLTSNGAEGVGGSASDLQCLIALNAKIAFHIHPEDEVEVFW